MGTTSIGFEGDFTQGFEPIEAEQLASVYGGNKSLIGTGGAMIMSSIGMAALGAAALGPIGVMFAAGLAFMGGGFVGTGTYHGLTSHH
ncbi:MAG: hypothetical protein AAGI88_10285 [Pseudomonadota bacterium]